jgi:hypothetical protein
MFSIFKQAGEVEKLRAALGQTFRDIANLNNQLKKTNERIDEVVTKNLNKASTKKDEFKAEKNLEEKKKDLEEKKRLLRNAKARAKYHQQYKFKRFNKRREKANAQTQVS